MALAATHIRFALDLKSEYDIKDIKKYLSGTIYPDSRYLSDIDRNLTHNNNVLAPEFAKDDFKKGWQLHQICDMVQNKKRKELLPELTVPHDDEWNTKEWVLATVGKIIQDMNDMQSFNIQTYLNDLDEYIISPNNENVNDIKKYYQAIKKLYWGKKTTTLEDYGKMGLAIGLTKAHWKKIMPKLTEIQKNKKLVKRIGAIYPAMLKSHKEVLK